VTIKGDDIYVEADEDAFKISRRPPKCSSGVPPLNDRTVIIIGGGASGNAAAEKLRESVTKVDTTSKVVTLDNGENLKYDSLIIATGASPRSIPIPGIGLNNVFYLRTFEDYEKIEQEENKNLTIIGSSFIGMEVAAMCAKKVKVSVIGMEKVPFERVLGLEVGGAIQKLHEASGVSFYLQSGVKEIEPLMILADGRKIPADVIVIGAGVAPATGFLKDSPGFTLEKDGSLKVDENFKVEGLDDVFAIGKIAEIIAKKSAPSFKKIPYFWSNQLGKGIRYAGYAAGFDDVIIKGNLEEFKFAAYYARKYRR
ncbi:15640_t:CDS:2, partial [Racocetra fulgida]